MRKFFHILATLMATLFIELVLNDMILFEVHINRLFDVN